MYACEIINDIKKYRVLKEEFLIRHEQINIFIDDICRQAYIEWKKKYEETVLNFNDIRARIERYKVFISIGDKAKMVQTSVKKCLNEVSRLKQGLNELNSEKGILDRIFNRKLKNNQISAINQLTQKIDGDKAYYSSLEDDMRRVLLNEFGHEDIGKAKVDYSALLDREKELQDELLRLDRKLYHEDVLLNFSEEQKSAINDYFDIIRCLGFALVGEEGNIRTNLLGVKLERRTVFGKLIQLAQFVMLQKDNCEWPELDNNFSIPCRELYNELHDIFRYDYDDEDCYYGLICDSLPVNNHLKMQTGQLKLTMASDVDIALTEIDAGKLAETEDVAVETLFIFSDRFLEYIQNYAEQNNDMRLPIISENLRDEFDIQTTEADNYVLQEFRRLYTATPEQILIDEQRYYKERELEQIKENARLERESYERQERLNRRNEAKLAKIGWKQAERQHNELLKQQEIFAKEEARRQAEQDRRQREEKRKGGLEEFKKRQEQMHLCWKCANYCNGCRGGIVGCGNFRPKR